MSFPIDIIFLAIILVFAIVSAIKGFINAIFNKLCWILGLVAAFLFYNMLSVPMMDFVKNKYKLKNQNFSHFDCRLSAKFLILEMGIWSMAQILL